MCNKIGLNSLLLLNAGRMLQEAAVKMAYKLKEAFINFLTRSALGRTQEM
jgi:hypothetical protein